MGDFYRPGFSWAMRDWGWGRHPPPIPGASIVPEILLVRVLYRNRTSNAKVAVWGVGREREKSILRLCDRLYYQFLLRIQNVIANYYTWCYG